MPIKVSELLRGFLDPGKDLLAYNTACQSQFFHHTRRIPRYHHCGDVFGDH